MIEMMAGDDDDYYYVVVVDDGMNTFAARPCARWFF